MLMRLGRGLAPAANRPLFPSKSFNFTTALPPEVTFNRGSAATVTNANGKLIQVAADQPRFDYTADGTPLGLFIEPEATNKCENYNINPTDISGFTTNNAGTLEVVDDSAALNIAGLDDICTNGIVFKATATSSSTFIIYVPGIVGNLNPHSVSLYARGEGVGNRTARLSIGGTALNIAPAGDSYKRYKHENLTPNNTGRKLTLAVDGNETLYFILYQLEENEFCTSIIPTNGAAVTRPADRAYINNIAGKEWLKPEHGYMICRYSQEKLNSNDSYAVTLNNGSSANTIGLRLDKTNHNLRAYLRANSSSEFTSANQDYQIEKTLNSAGIRWNETEAEIISGGETAQTSISQTPVNIDRLDIGARNGGVSPIHGHIQYIEIGTQDLTTQQLARKTQKPSDMLIIGAGQSLIRGHFTSQATGSEGGKQKHREIIGQYLRNKTITLVDGSSGASAACKTSNPTNYWWDISTNTRGPAFNNFYSQIKTIGVKPTIILWGQGEEDSHQIGLATPASDYKIALENIFADIRARFPDIEIYIQRIGRRNSFANVGGVQSVRDIQKELIAENDWCHEATEIYDLSLSDHVHLTDNGYITAAQRNALALTNQSGKIGPIISNVVRNGTSITVTLTHDNGNDFTPSSNIEGFKFFDDSAEINILSTNRNSSNTVILTLANAPNSGIETLYYGYDDMNGLNTANILTDNAPIPMPLRTSTIIL